MIHKPIYTHKYDKIMVTNELVVTNFIIMLNRSQYNLFLNRFCNNCIGLITFDTIIFRELLCTSIFITYVLRGFDCGKFSEEVIVATSYRCNVPLLYIAINMNELVDF